MSLLTSSVMPDVSLIQARIRSVVKRIPSLLTPLRFSNWYVNATGYFAVRAYVICSKDTPVTAVLTIRKGWCKQEYSYSSLLVVLPCKRNERRKAFRLACRQAEHLARLRYGYQTR